MRTSAAEFRRRYGPWALVAGASEGLGAAFAEQLAARGLNLLLVARREGPLAELRDRLLRSEVVQIRTVPLDLGGPDLLERVREAAAGIDIGLLVCNAASAYIGPFLDGPLDEQLRTLAVNCRAPLILAHELGRAMAARGRGGILLMSSLAASQGGPLIAAYSATKAWNLVFAEGLWDELRERGVDVLACRAGATRTPAFERSRPRGRLATMGPAPVVAQALDALGRGPSMVPGLMNRLALFLLSRLLPRRSAVRVLGRATRRLYGRS